MIEVRPGEGNPRGWQDDRSFDIHDAGGKIGFVTGHPWAGAEFRVTQVELTEPGRSLSPGEWKEVLHGLDKQLPEFELISGNRAGEGGGLDASCEKQAWLPSYQDRLAAAAARVPQKSNDKDRGR